MTNSHTRRDSVRIDDQVWTDALLGKRHVFLLVRHADSTLLSVAGGKLVADLRAADRAHFDLREPIAFFVCCQDHLVDHSCFGVLDLGRAVFAWLKYVGRCDFRCTALHILCQTLNMPHCRRLSDNDVVSVDDRTRVDDAIEIQLIIGAHAPALSSLEVGPLKNLIFVLRLRVSPEEGGPEKTPVDGRLVSNDRIFLVVASVACDRDNSVTAGRKFLEMEQLH